MAILKAFKGIRPVKDKADKIASRPYDVLNSEEARIEAKDNPYSFLHVVKPEIDLPVKVDHYSPQVYEKGKDNLCKMINDGLMFRDEKKHLYIYALTMNGKRQIGLVGCAGVEDYLNGVIKKHELTRPDKEEDRKNHVRVSMANAEPVFFAYPDMLELDVIIYDAIKRNVEYDFTTEDGITHEFWVIRDEDTIKEIQRLFAKIPYTYVADGHHRTAAAALVGNELKEKNPNHKGDEEYNYFLAVHFPASQLTICDYNRVVKDLNGLTEKAFIDKLKVNFEVKEKSYNEYKPKQLHKFGMYLNGKWYSLTAKEGAYDDSDPIDVLDVTILYNHVLKPVLNIGDLRTDKRIDFVGGIRGLGELKKRVDSGEMKVAFSLYPVSMKQLMNIADTGNTMPPKTTWFEPKLRSGLIVHSLE
ncbi:MAG: DUF1015 domain-containing protein [Ignavibacteriae bacterium]|nr:MAG: DUF1015 domain-containing protein [Ignavibacteriota bacterium]